MSIAGHWKGLYYQELGGQSHAPSERLTFNQFPIEAWFELDGGAIRGRMTDTRPQREIPACLWFECARYRMGFIQYMKTQYWVKKHPDAVYWLSLCSESTLIGSIDEREVSFLKQYVGPCESGFRWGAKESKSRWEDSVLHYKGTLSDDGKSIVGSYELTPGSNPNAYLGRLTKFELFRN